MIKTLIYFEKDGVVTFQSDDYCHVYDNMGKLAKEVYKFYHQQPLFSTEGWRADQPENRILEFDPKDYYIVDLSHFDKCDDELDRYNFQSSLFFRNYCKLFKLFIGEGDFSGQEGQFMEWLRWVGYKPSLQPYSHPEWLVELLWKEYDS